MTAFNEALVEEAALDWFRGLQYDTAHGPELAPGEPNSERALWSDVVLQDRLKRVISELNPSIPADAQDEALKKVLNPETPSLIGNNRRFHAMLRDGVEVEYKRPDGTIAGDRVRLIDFTDLSKSDWLVVNQFRVKEGQHDRRPDVVVFINGLPLAVIELKNAVNEETTIWSAINQLQTYKQEIGTLFHYNALLVVSDGSNAL